MRSLELAKIAWEAETLRLRRMARRTTSRLVMTVVALPFLLGTLAFLELALWSYVASQFIAPFAALILAGVNIIFAGIFLLVAVVSSDSRVEVEALKVRQRALEDVGRQLTIAAMVGPATRFVFNQLRTSRSKR
jgi:hypothetical protein